MSEASNPAHLLAESVKLKVFAVLRHTVEPDRLKEMLDEHLEWMARHEEKGLILLSGPVLANGSGSCPDGMTILRTETATTAETIIRGDPLVAAGVVTIDICEWTINEGQIAIRCNLSNSSFSFE